MKLSPKAKCPDCGSLNLQTDHLDRENLGFRLTKVTGKWVITHDEPISASGAFLVWCHDCTAENWSDRIPGLWIRGSDQ